MTMQRLVLILSLGLLPSMAPANELLRVYELAVQNDTELQAAMHARQVGRETIRQTGGALLPQVTGRGEISYQEFEPKGFPTQTAEPYSVSLSVSLWLFNKEIWERWRQAGDRAALAESNYQSAEQSLILRATEAYFNVLAAADGVRLADAEQKAVERQLELAKRRFEVGLSAITDVQEAQARYDLTVAQMIEAEQALTSAHSAIAEITGPTKVNLQPLREEIPLAGPNPDSVAEWLKAAAETNMALMAAKLQTEIAEREVGIGASGHYPTLGVNASQTIGESAGFNSGEYEDRRATLQLNVPLFAGGSTQANVRSARATLEQRKAEQEGVRRRIERQVRDAYQGVIAGVSRVRALKQAVLSNTTALEASEVGLEVGARTAVDVLNAQRELYLAERNYARARYDYLLNVLQLKIAAGQLTRQDLIEVDSLLVREPGTGTSG
jgi:outer membrane protein